MDRFNLKSRFGIKFLTLPVMPLIQLDLTHIPHFYLTLTYLSSYFLFIAYRELYFLGYFTFYLIFIYLSSFICLPTFYLTLIDLSFHVAPLTNLDFFCPCICHLLLYHDLTLLYFGYKASKDQKTRKQFNISNIG